MILGKSSNGKIAPRQPYGFTRQASMTAKAAPPRCSHELFAGRAPGISLVHGRRVELAIWSISSAQDNGAEHEQGV